MSVTLGIGLRFANPDGLMGSETFEDFAEQVGTELESAGFEGGVATATGNSMTFHLDVTLPVEVDTFAEAVVQAIPVVDKAISSAIGRFPIWSSLEPVGWAVLEVNDD